MKNPKLGRMAILPMQLNGRDFIIMDGYKEWIWFTKRPYESLRSYKYKFQGRDPEGAYDYSYKLFKAVEENFNKDYYSGRIAPSQERKRRKVYGESCY
jgi:hypothetical protein